MNAKNIPILVLAAILLVAALACNAPASISATQATQTPWVVTATPVQFKSDAPVAGCPNQVPSTGWVGDKFGPEQTLPAKVNGPAIAEIWNPNTGLCALVKINDGETLDWKFSGAYWQAASQEALDARWPHHLAEFVAKPSNAKCKIFVSANDVPAQ